MVGSRPLGGSTINDVRFVPTILLPRSYQNSLYGTTPPGGYIKPPTSGSIRSRFWRLFSSFSQAAASSAVKKAFVPSSRGRSKGVMVRKSQTPCKSGLPSGVRDSVDAAVVVVGEVVWPMTVTGASNATALTRPPIEIRNRLFIGDLPFTCSIACEDAHT